MKAYNEMSREELLSLKEELDQRFADAKGKGLKLDMSRGKPGLAQLDMVMDIMDVLDSKADMRCETGVDTRNYGLMEGIPEARHLMSDMMGGIPAENVIVYGNSSLSIMYDTVSRCVTHGVLGSTPWCKLDKVKFLCPAPGYDRHFSITEFFGIEMIVIPMTPEGPDMDLVEEYVSKDPAVKGIWCVPKYSNPQGITYSDKTVRRFAALKPAAEDFRIYWDNAYSIHDLYEEEQDEILEIISECEKAGNPDMVFEFSSLSKVTFSGAGIAAFASSKANVEETKKYMSIMTIGYDKINQLRHTRYFKNVEGLRAHMRKHAAILRPKFEAVLGVLEKELGGLGIGEWTRPRGGYFISFVVLTGAGATFPYGKDPKDSNIRIAPTFPNSEELAAATDLFVLCVKLVSVEKLLAQ